MKTYFDFLNEREFTQKEREELADKGKALPDGSFPIENKEDLKNWCKDNQPYYKKHIPEVFEYFKQKMLQK